MPEYLEIQKKEEGEVKPEQTEKNSLGLFGVVIAILPRIAFAIFLILLVIWIVYSQDGFGFDPDHLFSWHALLMGVFVTFFLSESLMAFSSPFLFPLKGNQLASKGFHFFFHLLSVVCIVLGMTSIVQYKHLSEKPYVYPFFTCASPHSWMGIVTLALFGFQFFASILLNVGVDKTKLSPETLSLIKKGHQFLGKCTFAIGLATCASGFQDMQSSDLANNWMIEMMPSMVMTGMDEGYGPYTLNAQLSSACSVMLIVLGLFVFGALTFLKD